MSEIVHVAFGNPGGLDPVDCTVRDTPRHWQTAGAVAVTTDGTSIELKDYFGISGCTLSARDQYGELVEWGLDRAEAERLRDALTGWLDRGQL